MFPPGIVDLHKKELAAARLLMEDPTNKANGIAFRAAVDARIEAIKEHTAPTVAQVDAMINARWVAKAQARREAERAEENMTMRKRDRATMVARDEARKIARFTPASPLRP